MAKRKNLIYCFETITLVLKEKGKTILVKKKKKKSSNDHIPISGCDSFLQTVLKCLPAFLGKLRNKIKIDY